MSQRKATSELARRQMRSLGFQHGLAGRPTLYPDDASYRQSYRRGQERAQKVRENRVEEGE